MEQTIRVDGLENKTAKTGNTKYIILSDDKKYEFYQNKADGTASVAYTAFDELSPKLGDVLIVYVDETPESFTNEQGKLINYTKRRITKFIGRAESHEKPKIDAGGVNSTQIYPTPPLPPNSVLQGDLTAKVAELEKRIEKLEYYDLVDPNTGERIKF